MDRLLMLIVGGFYIVFMGFFVLFVVRLYQALTIYVYKNAHHLPSNRFKRYQSAPHHIADDESDIDSEIIE